MDMNIEVDGPSPEESPPSTPVAHPDGCGHKERDGVSTEGACEEKKAGTLILLDWDDTINPSSLVTSLGFRIDEDSKLPTALQRELEALEEIAIDMLETCNEHGHVVIVTNAETGWVELSGKRFVPRVLECLQRLQLPIISARSTYESRYPGSPADWKTAAFIEQVTHAAESAHAVCVMSIGDSLHEREAAHQVGARFENRAERDTERQYSGCVSSVKTVKMVERPTVEQLRRQLSLISTNFSDMVAEPHSFDVNLVCDAACDE
jgi:hypothetical protein